MSSDNSFASVRVYDSEGQLVSFSWGLVGDIDGFNEEQAKKVHNAVSTLRASGFTTNPPDAKEGERIETVWYVVRRAKIEDNGHETPIIDLYMQNERVNYKFFSAYLNTTEEVLAFETVSGLKLSDLRLFDGESALQKESPKFGQFSKEAPKHPKVALSKNPYYNPEEEDVKKRKPQYKFSRWLDAVPPTVDPKAGTQGSTSNQTGNAAGGSAGSGNVTDINAHWTTVKANRDLVIAVFAKAGANSREAMVAAMQIVEAGVTKLGETKAKDADEYVRWIEERYAKLGQNIAGAGAANDLRKNNPYGKAPGETFVDENGEIHIIQHDGTDFVDYSDSAVGGKDNNPLGEPQGTAALEGEYDWTPAGQAQFTKEILAQYPELDEKTLFIEMAIKNWIWHPDRERQLVADVAKEVGWKVRTTRVSYRDGGSKEKSCFVFHTAIGEVQYWGGTTEFTKMVSGSWARPNKVAAWRELKAPLDIEPLTLTWEAKRRDVDGVEYFVVTHAATADKLDATLNGDNELP